MANSNSQPQVYGIPNCGSVKKALDALKAKGLTPQLHDFKKQGLPADLLDTWLAQFGLDVVLNRKGTTWRNLAEADKAQFESPAGARTLLLAQPTLIKRPVVLLHGQWTVGKTDF